MPRFTLSPAKAPGGLGNRRIVDYVLRNRIHLLPVATLIIWAGPPLYESTPSWNALPSVLLAGFGVYQLNRVFDVEEDRINDPDGYAKTVAAKPLVHAMGIGAITASILLSLILTNYAATIALSLILLAGVFYSAPFLGGGAGGERIRLKQVPGLKNILPSVVWPFTTIVYPAMSGSGVHVLQLALAVTALAWGVLTIEIAWDVRDARGDRIAGIRTLANLWGARRALLIPLLGACAEALLIVALVYLDRLAQVWLLPAALLVLLPAIAYRWRDALADDRDRSHLLIVMDMFALALLGLAGRWGVQS